MKRVALITGGAKGIGAEIVKSLSDTYNVAFCYLTSVNEADVLCKSLKNGVIAYKCDITDELQVVTMVDEILKKYGRIDVLINNAATTNDTLFRDKSAESFSRVLNTNLIGAFNVSKIVGDIMYKQKFGKIINIASTNGINTYYPMCLEYDASKAGLISLTHNLAMQFAPYINVNAIAPGFIATDSEIKDMDEEYIKSEEEKIFLRRAGQPREVANLVKFLISDEASYINNEVIRIDGGMYGNYWELRYLILTTHIMCVRINRDNREIIKWKV